MACSLATAGRMAAWPVTRSRCSTSGPPRRRARRPTATTPRRCTTCGCPTGSRAAHGRRRARRVLAARVRPDPRQPAGAGLRRRRLPDRRPSSTAAPACPAAAGPGTADDVAAAVTAVRRDPDLGAPLRCWSATPPAASWSTWAAAQPWAHGLRGVVSLAGVLDLAPRRARPAWAATPSRAFLGGRPADVPDAYAAADPARLAPGIPDAVGARPRRRRGALRAERAVCRGAPRARTCASRRWPSGGHYGLIDPEHPAFARGPRGGRPARLLGWRHARPTAPTCPRSACTW